MIRLFTYTTFLIMLFTFNVNAQWKYSESESDFDGKYRMARVEGTGNEFPYNSPLLTITLWDEENFNLYLSGIGYLGCDKNLLIFKFNGDEELYYSNGVAVGKNEKALYIGDFTGIQRSEFIELLKKHSSVSVRFDNECSQRDFKFTLSGSTKALNFVLKDFVIKW